MERPKTSETLLADEEEGYLAQQVSGDQRQEPAIHSSPRDLRDLERTHAWQDIKRRLVYSLMARRDALETEGATAGGSLELIGQIAYIQGEIFNIRTMLEMPERLARQKEMEIENEQQRRQRTAEESNR